MGNESTVEQQSPQSPSTPASTDTPGNQPVPEEKSEALLKELSRVRDKNRQLELSLAELRGQINAKQDQQTTDAFKSATESQLIEAELAWEEFRDKSRGEGDQEKIAQANAALKRIRSELHERTKLAASQQTRQGQLETIYQQLISRGTAKLPDLSDPSSPLYRASEAIYNEYSPLLNQLGGLGSLAAVALAIVENPSLVSTTVRKQLTQELESAVNNSLKAGSTVGAIKQSGIMPKNYDEWDQAVSDIRLGKKSIRDFVGG